MKVNTKLFRHQRKDHQEKGKMETERKAHMAKVLNAEP